MSRKMALAGLILMVSLVGTGSLSSPAVAQGVPVVTKANRLDDPEYVGRLLLNARPICDSGQTRTLKELKTELDRSVFSDPIELVQPALTEVPLPDLYSARCRSILTVARAFKCNKCQNWHLGNEATAFALTPTGVMATCRHVFERAEDGPVIVADQDGNVFPVKEILASSINDDVAIFRVDLGASQPSGAPIPEPVPLRSEARVGSSINVISHPGNLHYVLTRGIIARRTDKPGGLGKPGGSTQAQSSPVLNITAEFAVGSSGAPVLDNAGNAVAMVVSTSTIHADGKRDGETQMVIRNCIGVEQIQRLLQARNRVTAAVGGDSPNRP